MATTINISGPIIVLNYVRSEQEKRLCIQCEKDLPLTSFRKIGSKLNKTCSECIDKYCRRCEEHGKVIRYCRECKGSSLCEHLIAKGKCRVCTDGGSSYCIHNKSSDHCAICKPANHLRQIVYGRIYDKIGTYYASQWRELLGCTLEEYKEYIESKWEPWMNWSNHGKLPTDWNIDHTIPIDFQNPPLELKLQRFHYTNTGPMRVSENAAKQNNFVS